MKPSLTGFQGGARLAGFLFLIATVFYFTPLGDWLRHLSYELPFVFRKPVAVDEAVLVFIDEPSHRYLKQPYDRPWQRSLHAQLLHRLKASGAKAVAFDILFEEPTNTEEDAQFAEAMRDYGKVVLATKVTPQRLPGGAVVWALSPIYSNFTAHARWGVVEATAMQDPFPRQHFPGAAEEPSFAWRVAELIMTNPPPANPSRARWMNYYGPPLSLPHISYWQVISNTPEAQVMFSNRVVFVGSHIDIGYTGGNATEYFRTPWSRRTGQLSPGVEVNAVAYLNLARNDWLSAASEWTNVLMLVGAAIILGWLVNVLRSPFRMTLAAVAVGVLVAAVACLMAWQTHTWLAWMVVCAVQVPGAVVGGFWMKHKHTTSRAVALEEELAALALRDALPASTSASIQSLARPAELYVPAASALPAAAARDGATPTIPDHEVIRVIGRGAYGQVWLARNVIGSYHAVKIVYRKQFQDSVPFEREFRGMQKFTPISREHAGFVHVLHVGPADPAATGYFYYVMEAGDDQVTGHKIAPDTYTPKTLGTELARSGRLSVEVCIALAKDLTSALQHLHDHQLIHRDIKPSNIIFVKGRPKFADIGLVTDVAGDSTVSYLGTQGYIAPEGPGTPAADVYSLGKVLYEAMTGLNRDRFPDLPTEFMNSDPSPELFKFNRIVVKACEREVARRYQTAAAMFDDLRLLLKH